MALLKNVKVEWPKLRPGHPETDEDDNPAAWTIQAQVDKKTAKAWKKDKKAGYREIEHDDKDETYAIKFSRKITFKNGDDKPPVEVFDAKMRPIDVNETGIGNGSVCNIQYATYDYVYKGKKGVGVELIAVQVVKLVEYSGGGVEAGSEFEVVENDSEFDSGTEEEDEY